MRACMHVFSVRVQSARSVQVPLGGLVALPTLRFLCIGCPGSKLPADASHGWTTLCDVLCDPAGFLRPVARDPHGPWPVADA